MSEPKVTAEELQKFKQLDDERLELGRRAELLDKVLKPIREKLRKIVEVAGGADRTCVRQGFVLAFKRGQRRPKWQEAYLIELGADKAQKLIDETPYGEVLTVEPVA